MISRQQSHKPGTFPACRSCKIEPRHFVYGGGMFASGISSERHMIECSRCENRTAKLPTLAAVESEWKLYHAVPQRSEGVLTLKRNAR